MAEHSLTYIASVINQHIEAQETLNEQLFKVKALACVTVAQDFLDFEPSIIQGYLCVLIDLVTEAKKINDEALSSFLKNSRALGLRDNHLIILMKLIL